MYTIPVAATGVVNLTPERATALHRLDTSIVSCIEVTVSGLVGSMTPQIQQEMDGDESTPPLAKDCLYRNLATGSDVSPPVAITADGTYVWDTPGQVALLNVTALTGSCTLYVKPLQGPAPSGGGSGTSSTVAGTDADNAVNSTTKVPVIVGVANAVSPSWTEAHEVPLSVDLSGNLRTLSAGSAADNSTNGTAKLPVLPVTANAAAPTWTEGHQAPLSTDLAGNARVIAHGYATLIKPTCTVSTSPAYTSGDDAGGKLTIANAVATSGGVGVFQSLELFFKSGTAPTGVFLLFDADPTAATITDNTAFAWSTDQAKCIGVIPVVAGDLITVGGQIIAKPSFTPFLVMPATGTTLYAAYVLTSTPTFTATTDMLCTVGVIQN